MIRKNIRSLTFSPTLAIHEKVMQMRKDGEDIIHMGFGQSPFPVHPLIEQSLRENADKSMYLPSAGLEELREAALEYYGQRLGFDSTLFYAIIGPGSKELIFDVQLAVEGGLLMPIPSWVSYAPQARIINDRVIPIQTRIEDSLHITAERLEGAIERAKTEGKKPSKLILNYPNNPSGLSMDSDRLREIAEVCKKHSVLIISDEIYGLVRYDGKHSSIAEYYPEGTIVTGGLSKHLSLGGYRLGVAMVPNEQAGLLKAMLGIASETFSCVSSPIQYAALKAYEGNEILEHYIRECCRIHGLISKDLRNRIVDTGIEYPEPQGAFYVFPDFTPFRDRLKETYGVSTNEELATDLLERAQVAVLPGSGFGDDPENLTIRISACDFDGHAVYEYCKTHPETDGRALTETCCPDITEGCSRIVSYIENCHV